MGRDAWVERVCLEGLGEAATRPIVLDYETFSQYILVQIIMLLSPFLVFCWMR